MPTGYYYWTHGEYQLLQQGIKVLKGRIHQGILDTTGKSEESRFVKHAVLRWCQELVEEYNVAQLQTMP